MSATELTVVIPTFNNTALLIECLRSVHEQTAPPDSIVVVDDGSTEDVAQTVRRDFPDVRVVRLPSNQGFCGAANTGLRAANTQYIFLLNNDMTLDSACIEALMRRANPTSILTPLVLFKSDPSVIYSAGDRILTNGRPESIGFRERRVAFEHPASIFGATGGAALIPRSILDRIGYFDGTFVAYFEDADLCMRARLAGFGCALVPDAIAYHVGSASLDGKTWWRSRQCFRNHGLLIVKNFPVSVFLRLLPAILRERLHQAATALSSARAEFGLVRAMGVLLAAAAGLLAALPHAIRARAHLRRRAISNGDFIALLTRPADRS